MNVTIKNAIRYGLFPTVFTAAIAGAIFAMKAGIDPGYITATVAVLTVIIVYIFERILPMHDNWLKSHNDVKTDLLHGTFSMILIPQLLEALLLTVLLGVAVKIASMVGFSIWPTHWPIVFQLILAMIVSQFGEYWWHRLSHEVPLFWRFHSIHHSPKRLYWLNAARFHPVDIAVSYSLAVSTLILLGATTEILTLLTVWIIVHGLFQHCNIDIRLGFLNYIFSMAELHRWHHSLVLEEANANYGNNILFWDIIFGTVYYPKDKIASEHIGLHDFEAFPENYVDQIKAPFQWKKLE